MSEWLGRCLALALVTATADAASAATITFEFAGVVTRGPEWGGLDASVAPGVPWQAAIAFDSEAPNVSGAPQQAVYVMSSFRVSVGSFAFQSRPPTETEQLSYPFSHPTPYLVVDPPASVMYASPYSEALRQGELWGPGRIILWIQAGTPESMALPTRPPAMPLGGYIEVLDSAAHDPVRLFSGTVASVVPEPASGPQLGVACALLLAARGLRGSLIGSAER